MQAENRQNKENLSAFAHRLGVLAGRKRLKQIEIARLLNTPQAPVSPQRVGSWFQGRNFPGGDVEYALAALFGVSRDWLILGQEDTVKTDSSFGKVEEGPGQYGDPVTAMLVGQIEKEIRELRAFAANDIGRLGWLREELRKLAKRVDHELGDEDPAVRDAIRAGRKAGFKQAGELKSAASAATDPEGKTG